MSGSTLQFWRPGTVRPGSNVDRATEIEENIVPSAPASASLSIQAQRERLPVYKHSNVKFSDFLRFLSHNRYQGREILYCVEKYGVVIVHAQTGAGKTTRRSNIIITNAYVVLTPWSLFLPQRYRSTFMKRGGLLVET